MFYFVNTAIVVKTRKPKDEQLCKAVNIYIYIMKHQYLRQIKKESMHIYSHALHNMGAHLGSQN